MLQFFIWTVLSQKTTDPNKNVSEKEKRLTFLRTGFIANLPENDLAFSRKTFKKIENLLQG
jgi:hypothetical protein